MSGYQSSTGEALAHLSVSLKGVPRVAFDLDGTLYDTRDFERPALAAVASWLRTHCERPLPGLVNELWHRREFERHRRGLFDDLLEKYELPLDWGKECLRIFHDYPADELRHSASLADYLSELRRNGHHLALVTNGPQALQERKLRQLHLEELFDECICCTPQYASRQKPHGWAWTQLANWRCGQVTVFVGDDEADARFAAAGDARFFPLRFRSVIYAD